MTIPPIPPSDDLYKFTAIGGLIIVLLSVYVPWKVEADIDAEAIEARSQADAFDYELKQYQIQKAASQEHQKVLEAVLAKAPLSPEVTLLRLSVIDKHLDAMAEQAKRMDRIALTERQAQASAQKIQLWTRQSRGIQFIGGMFLGIGLTLTWVGFYNWYHKSQVPKDRIIKAQAEHWTTVRTLGHEKEEVPG